MVICPQLYERQLIKLNTFNIALSHHKVFKTYQRLILDAVRIHMNIRVGLPSRGTHILFPAGELASIDGRLFTCCQYSVAVPFVHDCVGGPQDGLCPYISWWPRVQWPQLVLSSQWLRLSSGLTTTVAAVPPSQPCHRHRHCSGSVSSVQCCKRA